MELIDYKKELTRVYYDSTPQGRREREQRLAQACKMLDRPLPTLSPVERSAEIVDDANFWIIRQMDEMTLIYPLLNKNDRFAILALLKNQSKLFNDICNVIELGQVQKLEYDYNMPGKLKIKNNQLWNAMKIAHGLGFHIRYFTNNLADVFPVLLDNEKSVIVYTLRGECERFDAILKEFESWTVANNK